MDTLSLPPQGLVGAAIYHSPSEEEGISQKVHKYGGDRYKDAGVDIDAGNAFIEAIKPLAEATKRPGVASNLGGFGALFDLKEAGYQDPRPVTTPDGRGTLRQLLDADLVRVSIGADDGRQRIYELTAGGRRVLGRLRKQRAAAIASVWQPLGKRALANFARFAEGLADRLEAYADSV